MSGHDDASTTRARIVEDICARIATGESVRSIFATPGEGYPAAESTFWRWLHADPELVTIYEHATARRGEKYGEEVVEIVDSAGSPLLNENGTPILDRDGHVVMVVDRVAVEYAKLRADTRKWVAGRMASKRYGDRTVIAGDAENPIALADGSAIARKLLHGATAGGTPEAPSDTDDD